MHIRLASLHPFNPIWLQHAVISSTCADSSQTVNPPTRSKLKFHPLNLNPSSWTTSENTDTRTDTHIERQTHSPVMGEPPADSFAQRLSLLAHISPCNPPSLAFFFFFSCLPDVKARRECYCNAEWFTQDCKYWPLWLPLPVCSLLRSSEGMERKTSLSHDGKGVSNSFYIPVDLRIG